MINKKGFEFSFAWLFAIVIGIAFISGAIYVATTILDFSKASSSASSAKEFGIILSPIETGLDDGKTSLIDFITNTRVYFDCDNVGYFGNQQISTSSQSSVGTEWARPGAKVSFNNKYVFSSNVVEGKNIVAFAKPLMMPYKVADLIYIWSQKDKFCFIDTPIEIEKEIKGLQINSINISSDGKCPRNSTTVCFSRSGCDIDVNINANSVKKYKRTVYYSEDSSNSLMYAAIFADPGIYECQIKRLMKKNSNLAEVYLSKTLALSARGCNSNLEYELSLFSNTTRMINNTMDVREIQIQADEIDRRNNALDCKLF